MILDGCRLFWVVFLFWIVFKMVSKDRWKLLTGSGLQWACAGLALSFLVHTGSLEAAQKQTQQKSKPDVSLSEQFLSGKYWPCKKPRLSHFKATLPLDADFGEGFGEGFGEAFGADLNAKLDQFSKARHSKMRYVSGGIPFHKGLLKDPEAIEIYNSACQRIKFQSRILARWPDQSIKSLLLTLQRPEGQRQAKKTRLTRFFLGITDRFDPVSVQTKAPTIKPELFHRIDADSLMVDTGLLQVRIPTRKFALLSEVRRKGGVRDPIILSGGDLYLVNAQQRLQNRNKYFASLGQPHVAVESAGPLSLVVKSEGEFKNLWRDALLHYQIRYTFYAGTDYFDLDFTVIDKRPEENVMEKRTALALAVSDYGIRIGHTIQSGKFYFGGETGSGAVIDGKLSAEHSLIQLGGMHYEAGNTGELGKPLYDFAFRTKGKMPEATGKKAAGWAAISGQQQAVAILVKDFWQQYPNRFSLSPKQFEISLHPREALQGQTPDVEQVVQQEGTPYRRPNTFYFTREGGAKTYQLRIVLPEGDAIAQQINDINEDFQSHRLRLKTDLAWYADTGVFGDIRPASKATAYYDEFLFERVYQASMKKSQLMRIYGWRDYGDRLRPGWAGEENGVKIPGFYNDTHVGANMFFTHYLRTGQPEWFEFAVLSTRHFMDIDVSHSRRKGRWKINGSKKRYAPPGEIHAIKHEQIDHQTRNLHFGHAHVSGLSNYYLLTGNPRSLEVLTMIGDWWRAMIPQFFPLPRPADSFSEAERDFGWPLYVLNEVVRVTNDRALHNETAARLVRFLIDWWQVGGAHIINGQTIGHHDYRQGTGWWRMADMDNGSGTGTNPWMAGALLSSLIQFYQADLEYQSGIDQKALKEMLYQTMNYVVKYGWQPQSEKKQHLGRGHFVYSEARPSVKGDVSHLLYPLARLYQMLQEDIAYNEVAHLEWYDTYPLWKAIPMYYYEEMKKKRYPHGGGSKYGFYGYEIIFPEDFFSVVEKIKD